MAKVVVIEGEAKSLVDFRGDLMKELVCYGNEVIAMAPGNGVEETLKQFCDIKYISIPLNRTGINPCSDAYTVLFLFFIFLKIRPDIVFSFSSKPVIFSSIAAHLARVPQIYAMITGLGYVFTGKNFKQRILATLVQHMYRLAINKNAKVFFQNKDDLNLFIKARMLINKEKATIVNGSGVNISKFLPSRPKENPITFLFMARLIWDKGIGDFVEAARILKKHYNNVTFKILGPFDTNPNAIRKENILKWQSEGLIEYLGETDDVRPFINDCSIFVLPSYREGTPRSILEAMSSGRPIITTDAPGCRETVDNGVNGIIVPVKDSVSLSRAMEKFILNPALIHMMGEKSREIAVTKYDVNKVNSVLLKSMQLI